MAIHLLRLQDGGWICVSLSVCTGSPVCPERLLTKYISLERGPMAIARLQTARALL